MLITAMTTANTSVRLQSLPSLAATAAPVCVADGLVTTAAVVDAAAIALPVPVALDDAEPVLLVVAGFGEPEVVLVPLTAATVFVPSLKPTFAMMA